jgi:hypothetical protein
MAPGLWLVAATAPIPVRWQTCSLVASIAGDAAAGQDR